MRYIVIIFILFTSCQKDISATLVVNVKPGDSTIKTQILQFQSKLYKEGRFYRKIRQPEVPVQLPQAIRIDSLQKGKYTFEYPDLYGNFIRQNILIEESKTYHINLYPDITKRVSEKNIISNLKNGEKLELKVNSIGCFHSLTKSVYILKKNNQIEIGRNNVSKLLSSEDTKYLIDLENSIRLLNDGGCTTSHSFIFIFKNKSDTITDSGCEFESMQKFTKLLRRNGL